MRRVLHAGIGLSLVAAWGSPLGADLDADLDAAGVVESAVGIRQAYTASGRCRTRPARRRAAHS
jgi:hypothetical protein